LKIRPWSEEDIPGIRNVIWTTWLSAYSSFIPEKDLKVCFDEWYGEAALRNNLSDSLVEGSVAVEGENILASMRCRWSPEENRVRPRDGNERAVEVPDPRHDRPVVEPDDELL